MRTLLITTGGTIACTMTENGLSPTLTATSILEKSNISCDYIDLDIIDSSIMTNDFRFRLASIIWEKRSNYDKFIITHGTDTMAYTAAFLENCLENFNKCVILTGSQLPFHADNSDAKTNVVNSFNCDIQSGVFIMSYDKLIPAETVTKVSTSDYHAFRAVSSKTYNESYHRNFKSTLNENIALVYINPFLNEEDILKLKTKDKVLAVAYGNGGMNSSQLAAFNKLYENNVKLYMISQCENGSIEQKYEAHKNNIFTAINDVSVEYALFSLAFND